MKNNMIYWDWTEFLNLVKIRMIFWVENMVNVEVAFSVSKYIPDCTKIISQLCSQSYKYTTNWIKIFSFASIVNEIVVKFSWFPDKQTCLCFSLQVFKINSPGQQPLLEILCLPVHLASAFWAGCPLPHVCVWVLVNLKLCSCMI